MKGDIDYDWGWNQIERYLDKAYGASANICNIASHIRNRSIEEKKVCELCEGKKKIWEDEDGRRVYNDCPNCVE